jgi:hypothetical protein
MKKVIQKMVRGDADPAICGRGYVYRIGDLIVDNQMTEGEQIMTVSRRTVLTGLAAGAVAAPLAACSGSGSTRTSSTTTANTEAAMGGAFSLTFDTSDYTTLTKTVSVGSDNVTVKYRFYRNNVYVRHAVNYKYQSLNVSVPIEINGKAVDATSAPVMFSINVGGYTSSSSWGATGQGGGMSGGSAAGGFAGGQSGSKTGKSGAPGGSGGPPSGSSGGGPGGSSSSGAPSGSGGPGGSGGGGASLGAGSVGLGSSMASYYTSYDDGEMALAHGYVVVEPGCRGRDLQWSDGKYYGKAPTMIIDLKAAVRYLRYNASRIPGNMDWIITTGGSAGGALSTMVAASGNSSLYDDDLNALGAADESDSVWLSASYSPITDLDHADMQYEWMWGTLPYGSGLVNQTYSKQLIEQFGGYLDTLALRGINGSGMLTVENYASYMLDNYLIPSATKALSDTLTTAEREAYLKKNTWITWSGGEAAFSYEKFLKHVGTRIKTVPAFDGFDLQETENSVYGDADANARHFTLYSLRHATGDPTAQLASDLPQTIAMMNPMYHLRQKNPDRAKHWWIRTGSLDTNTAHTVVCDLAAITTGLGDSVNSALYWDGGHAVNFDSPDLMSWIGQLTGYSV